jgi:hypothetical protein
MTMFNDPTRKPQAQARRFIYRCIATALDNDAELSRGWFWPGEDESITEADRRRIRKAAKAVYNEMLRKADK